MVLELLRSLLIDWALDHHNEDMFRRLTSATWADEVISPESEEKEEGPADKKYLILRERRGSRLAVYRFPSVVDEVVFAVPEDDWDDCGWRDVYGFTFYDRLRSAGYRTQAMWILVERKEYDEISSSYHVAHPRQLTLSHPTRTCTVTKNDSSSGGQQKKR